MGDVATDVPTGGALKIEFGPNLGGQLEPGYDAPATTVTGVAFSAAFRPRRSDIWCLEAHLGAEARLNWGGDHGEEVLHVIGGTLSYDGHDCPPGSTIIVDAAVPAEVLVREAARVLHFGAGPTPPSNGPFGAPAADGAGVRVIGPRGLAEYAEPGRLARYWADGSAPTSRVTLFSSAREGPVPQAPHSHSVDEIFMITVGSIEVGRRTIEAGMVVFVAGDQRYAFRGGPDGYTMINYRPDASYFSLPGAGDPQIEGVNYPGITWVGDVIVA